MVSISYILVSLSRLVDFYNAKLRRVVLDDNRIVHQCMVMYTCVASAETLKCFERKGLNLWHETQMQYGCVFPKAWMNSFEMVRFERTEQAYDIWLDEKKRLSDEDYRNPHIVARGYTEYVTIQDYPMRGRPYSCTCARTNGGTGRPMKSSVTTSSSPNEEGTRLSAEFVSFLKDEGGDDGTVD